MAFNLALLSGPPRRRPWLGPLAAALTAVGPVAPGAPGTSAPPPDAAATAPPADTASWPRAARRALEAWETAVSTEEKLAAVEALAALSAEHPLVLAPLQAELSSAEAPVRARLLDALSRAGLPEAAEAARHALLDPDPALAVTAAAVLGRSAPAGVRDSLTALWRQAAPPAPGVSEAATTALAQAVPAAGLAALKADAHPGIRRAALNALRRQGARACAEFLALTELADEAAAALYDDRLEGGWPALVEAGLRADSPLAAPGRARAIAAAWHAGGAANADRLAAWLAAQPRPAEGAAPDPSARAAWRALLAWDAPPDDDPVLAGRPFRARPRPPAQSWEALVRHAPALQAWAGAFGGETAAGWTAWQARLARAPRAAKDLAAFLGDASHPEGERLYHFRTRLSGPSDASALPDLAAAALAAAALAAPDAPSLRAEARAWLFRRRGPDAVPWLLQSLANATATEKQAAIRLLDHPRSPEGDAYLVRLLGQARLGLVDPAVLPEVVEAVERRTRAEGPESRGLRAALDAWRASQVPSPGDPLRPWRPALQPGDAETGRDLFFSASARCASCHRAAPAASAASAASADPADARRAPALDGLAARLDGPALLEAVVLPDDPAPPRQPGPADGGCRPAGTLFTLRELRDLLAYLRSLP